MNVVLLILIGAVLAAIMAWSLSAFGRGDNAPSDDGPILPFGGSSYSDDANDDDED
jgi:hypothetical protein